MTNIRRGSNERLASADVYKFLYDGPFAKVEDIDAANACSNSDAEGGPTELKRLAQLNLTSKQSDAGERSSHVFSVYHYVGNNKSHQKCVLSM